jgi:hypothetical protein
MYQTLQSLELAALLKRRQIDYGPQEDRSPTHLATFEQHPQDLPVVQRPEEGHAGQELALELKLLRAALIAGADVADIARKLVVSDTAVSKHIGNIFTKLGVMLVFGLGISAMSTLDLGGGILEALGRLLAGTVLLLISAFVPIVAFKFFSFLGEQTVDSLHAGASSGVHRSKEVVGTLSPTRVMERVNGHSQAGPSANGTSRNGSGPQAGQATGAQQRRFHTGRPQRSPATRPAGAGARAGAAGGGAKGAAASAGAAGGAATGVGAVVGAGLAAANKIKSVGHKAAEQVAADDPYVYDPSRKRRQQPPPGPGKPRQK